MEGQISSDQAAICQLDSPLGQRNRKLLRTCYAPAAGKRTRRAGLSVFGTSRRRDRDLAEFPLVVLEVRLDESMRAVFDEIRAAHDASTCS